MSQVNLPHSISSGDADNPTRDMANWTTIRDIINGNLDNTNLSASAAIAGSKIDENTLQFHGCLLYKSASEAYASGSYANVLFDSESYDTDSYHSTSANTQRITVPIAGYYHFFATVQYANNAAGIRVIRLDKNATTYFFKKSHAATDGGTANGYLSTSGVILLAANDFIEVNFYQDSGGNLNIIGGDAEATTFGCEFLGV